MNYQDYVRNCLKDLLDTQMDSFIKTFGHEHEATIKFARYAEVQKKVIDETSGIDYHASIRWHNAVAKAFMRRYIERDNADV